MKQIPGYVMECRVEAVKTDTEDRHCGVNVEQARPCYKHDHASESYNSHTQVIASL